MPVYADYDRKKRAVNVTGNVMENIINDTFMEEIRYNETTEMPLNETTVETTTRFDGNDTTKYAEPFRFLGELSFCLKGFFLTAIVIFN